MTNSTRRSSLTYEQTAYQIPLIPGFVSKINLLNGNKIYLIGTSRNFLSSAVVKIYVYRKIILNAKSDFKFLDRRVASKSRKTSASD